MTERRLRVLAVSSHPVQYAVPVFRLLARHPRVDFQVAYCSLRGAEAGHDPEFDTTVKWDIPLLEGYRWTHIPNRGSGSESFWGLCNPGLWSFIRNGRFDAVWSHLPYVQSSFWIGRLSARSSGAAFVFGCDQVSLESRDGRRWKTWVKRVLWPQLFAMADHVVVSSTRAKQLILSLRIPEERVSLTPLVVDNDWWMRESAKVDRGAIRLSWGAGDNDVVALFCAKLQPWKRPQDLLQAFASLKQTNARLVFAGDGPLRQQLENQAIALGIGGRVRFLGFVNQSQLSAVYTAADLMVLPSEYEPFGVVVNEAMCCGCPVMVSDQVGAGPDLVAPVERSFVFRCGDVEQIAALLSNAISHRAYLGETGRRSIARMRRHSPENTVSAIVEAIERAVSLRRSSKFTKPVVSASDSSVSGMTRT